MSSPTTSYLLFVACSPGIEELLRDELMRWGLTGEITAGGVELRTPARGLWTLCRESRLAESVRVRLKPFEARTFDALVEGFRRLPWHAYVPQHGSVVVRVTCHHSRLRHSGAVMERLMNVLAERRGVEKAAEGAASLGIYVRLLRDRVQVSIDASGERLHRRGYRTHVVEGSLRETLAAALVSIGERVAPAATVLWDPFCGAGTIPLEWLEMKLGRVAGERRGFAFEQWPSHDAQAYAQWLDECQQREASPQQTVRIIGSDRSERAIEASRANAARAELASQCTWLRADFEEAAEQVPSGALVVTNPPYGRRVKDSDLRGAALGRFGALLQRRADLRPVVLLLPRGPKNIDHRALDEVLRTSNGGVAVGAYLLRK